LSQPRAATQVAPPGSSGEPQRQKGAAYLPLRILPNGLTPLLLCSYALSVLPTALNFVLPDVARALTASVLSPGALPWTFGVFVVLFEAIGARLGARSVARDLADWLATVRPCSRGSNSSREAHACAWRGLGGGASSCAVAFLGCREKQSLRSLHGSTAGKRWTCLRLALCWGAMDCIHGHDQPAGTVSATPACAKELCGSKSRSTRPMLGLLCGSCEGH